MEEAGPSLAPYPTSEPRSVGPSPSPSFFFFCWLSLCHAAQHGTAQTDTDSGEKGREACTSEASLVSNKKGDQTCSPPVKENVIVENGRTG